MIEAGKEYTITEGLIARYQLLNKCRVDKDLRLLCMELSRRDKIFWVNNFVYTYDPRRKPAFIPFMLFPKQIEYLKWRDERVQHKEHGLIEKSRDMGLTCLNITDQLHYWLFDTNFKGAFGSRKEILVDRKGDPDSIFEKLRMVLRYLPKWMIPQDFNWNVHDNHLRLINPVTGATITGEAGDNLGRGGRSTLYDIDEFAFVERADSVDAALSQNTDVVFYTSTPNGLGNCYAKKRFSGKIKVFTFKWQDDPRKNEDWYQKQVNNLDPITVAQEIDVDYTASVENVYIPHKWVLASVGLQIPITGNPVGSLDIATFGKNRTVLGIRVGGTVTYIEDWSGVGTTESAFKVRELMIELEATMLNFDADGVGEGVGSTLASIEGGLPFAFIPLRGAATPSDTYWEGEQRTSKEKFANARAEWWGLLRERFKKTYDHTTGIKAYPLDELISIPNHPELIAQISLPKRKYTSSGKILLESKAEMRKRGIDSPDFADMLAMLFAPSYSYEDVLNAWLN